MSYNCYGFKNKEVEKLFDQAIAQQTSSNTQDLPWNPQRSEKIRELTLSEVPSLLENLPEYQKLSLEQKKDLLFKEEVYHICNLLAGEDKAVLIAAQVIAESPRNIPDWTHGMSTLLFDETKHFRMLSRYLMEEIGLCYAPHPKIDSILKALVEETSPEIKMFVSQVVLEWTAISLLASILFKKPEPLLGKIVRTILKDEGRHLALNRLAFSNLFSNDLSRLKSKMEDAMFEGIVSCTSSFFAIPVWQEYGFSKASCRQYASETLEKRGVLQFYSKVLPAELHRCGLHSERLINFLQKDLKKRIIEDHWSFEPVLADPMPSIDNDFSSREK